MPNSKKSKLVEWQKADDAPWCHLGATSDTSYSSAALHLPKLNQEPHR